MRNIDSSEWLTDPGLDVVQTVASGPEHQSQFKLFAQQVATSPDDDVKGDAKTTANAKPAAAKPGLSQVPRRRIGDREMSIIDDLRALDTNDPGRWPLAVPSRRGGDRVRRRARVRHLLLRLELDDKPALDREQRRETELKAAFEDRQRKAANFDAYRTQLADIERDFGAMLRQLPGKTEVPSLLVDISQTGLGAGLEEKLFQPTGEVQKGLLRGAADQASLHRQLSRARQICERHRCAAAHRDFT